MTCASEFWLNLNGPESFVQNEDLRSHRKDGIFSKMKTGNDVTMRMNLSWSGKIWRYLYTPYEPSWPSGHLAPAQSFSPNEDSYNEFGPSLVLPTTNHLNFVKFLYNFYFFRCEMSFFLLIQVIRTISFAPLFVVSLFIGILHFSNQS